MNHEPSARALVEFLRQAVVDAFAREHYPEKAEQRTALINALQGILEKSEPNAAGFLEVDFEDLFNLVQHRQAIMDAANLHERHFGNPELAQDLRNVMTGIEKAQAYLWRPYPDGPSPELDNEDDPEIHQTHAASL